MQLIRGLYNIQPNNKHCVATIGNFDGVHIGHQAILRTLTQQARELNVPSCVITFEPHPKAYLDHSSAPLRLNSLREKYTLLAQHGVDQLLCLPFNQQLRQQTADQFVIKTLVESLQISCLIIGDDFHYGCDRQGNFQHLYQLGQKYHFQVCDTNSVLQQHQRISSTAIRAALAKGNITKANQLLGHTFSITGRVTTGQQLGRQLGFPTANLNMQYRQLPLKGVFAVRVIVQGQRYNAVANVGTRPSVQGTQLRLETHLLDFHQDLYGQMIQVEFVQQIRDEQKFASLEALQTAISNDIDTARTIFAND